MENENNQTNTTAEKKQGWVKQHLALCVIILVILVAAGVGAYFLFANQGASPEEVATKYVEAMSEGNTDKLLEITDLKGAYAWEKCENDINKFKEEYKNAPEDEINSYKDKMKSSIDTAMGMLKTFGGVKITLKNVEKPESLGNGIYKVKANMQMEAFGQSQEQELKLVVYNGKYIGETK
ncbi:MAG: hypothetical protein IKF38_03710 [Clostridia bacterium]|nr:hypothetical protein [Clostridia bacterium]